jgi:hypothetical protein
MTKSPESILSRNKSQRLSNRLLVRFSRASTYPPQNRLEFGERLLKLSHKI